MTNEVEVGEDAVVIGDVTGIVGNGSVVIGPTDGNGNTIITQPMAVGRDAKAGPGSIAIGPGASSGSDLFHLIDQLKLVPEVQRDQTLLSTIEVLSSEVRKPKPQQETVNSLWSIIQSSASVGGAIGLVQQIGVMLGA